MKVPSGISQPLLLMVRGTISLKSEQQNAAHKEAPETVTETKDGEL